MDVREEMDFYHDLMSSVDHRREALLTHLRQTAIDKLRLADPRYVIPRDGTSNAQSLPAATAKTPQGERKGKDRRQHPGQ